MTSLAIADLKSVNKLDLVRFPIDSFVDNRSSNFRDYNDPEVIAQIRSMANAYKRGDKMPPLMVCVVDGVPHVLDGTLLLRGAKLAVSEIITWEDAGVPTLEAVVNQSLEDQIRSGAI